MYKVKFQWPSCRADVRLRYHVKPGVYCSVTTQVSGAVMMVVVKPGPREPSVITKDELKGEASVR